MFRSEQNTNVNNYAESADSADSADYTDTANNAKDVDSADTMRDVSSVDVGTKTRLQTVVFANWFASRIMQATRGDTSGDCQHRLADEVAQFVRHLAATRGSVSTPMRSVYCEDSAAEGVVERRSTDACTRRSVSACTRYGTVTPVVHTPTTRQVWRDDMKLDYFTCINPLKA